MSGKGILYVFILIGNCIASAVAQLLLKKAASRSYASFFHQYLNIYVITGYGLYFFVLAIGIYILKYMPMSVYSAISEPLLLIMSTLIGRVFFKEAITKRKVAGVIFIITGIFIILFYE